MANIARSVAAHGMLRHRVAADCNHCNQCSQRQAVKAVKAVEAKMYDREMMVCTIAASMLCYSPGLESFNSQKRLQSNFTTFEPIIFRPTTWQPDANPQRLPLECRGGRMSKTRSNHGDVKTSRYIEAFAVRSLQFTLDVQLKPLWLWYNKAVDLYNNYMIKLFPNIHPLTVHYWALFQVSRLCDMTLEAARCWFLYTWWFCSGLDVIRHDFYRKTARKHGDASSIPETT